MSGVKSYLSLSPDDFPVIGQSSYTGNGFRGTAYSLPSARLLLQLMMKTAGKGEGETCFETKYADPARFGL